MLDLIHTANGWCIDVAKTPEALTVAAAFGTTILPLPLGARCEEYRARAFAETTAFGLEYGIAGGYSISADVR